MLGLILVTLLAMALGFELHPLVRARLAPPADAGAAAARASAQPYALPPPVNPAAAAAAPNPKSEPVLDTAIGAYILQLGSYTSLSTTLRAIDIYAAQGLAAHWGALPCGPDRQCFHVFAGRFVSRQQARQFQTAQGLTTALVRYAPWTVLAGTTPTGTQAVMLQQRLRGQELDSYAVDDGDGRVHLCIGAFGSRAEAQSMALQIEEQTGINNEVIELSRLRPSLQTRASNTREERAP
jgi:cell division septation protein DedD